MRKRVETAISEIKKMFPRTIHAVTLQGKANIIYIWTTIKQSH
jgi:hypothetical protein